MESDQLHYSSWTIDWASISTPQHRCYNIILSTRNERIIATVIQPELLKIKHMKDTLVSGSGFIRNQQCLLLIWPFTCSGPGTPSQRTRSDPSSILLMTLCSYVCECICTHSYAMSWWLKWFLKTMTQFRHSAAPVLCKLWPCNFYQRTRSCTLISVEV